MRIINQSLHCYMAWSLYQYFMIYPFSYILIITSFFGWPLNWFAIVFHSCLCIHDCGISIYMMCVIDLLCSFCLQFAYLTGCLVCFDVPLSMHLFLYIVPLRALLLVIPSLVHCTLNQITTLDLSFCFLCTTSITSTCLCSCMVRLIMWIWGLTLLYVYMYMHEMVLLL